MFARVCPIIALYLNCVFFFFEVRFCVEFSLDMHKMLQLRTDCILNRVCAGNSRITAITTTVFCFSFIGFFLLVTEEIMQLHCHSVCALMAVCFATGITLLPNFKILHFLIIICWSFHYLSLFCYSVVMSGFTLCLLLIREGLHRVLGLLNCQLWYTARAHSNTRNTWEILPSTECLTQIFIIHWFQ